MENFQTLCLDRGMVPMRVISWQRAVQLLALGKIAVLEEYDHEIKSTNWSLRIPAVVVFTKGFKKPKKAVKFSRVNIYGRDNFCCQYCGEKGTLGTLTYDHVLPRAQGGKTEWTNIVTCCSECNGKKACRTPEQARMSLMKKPVQPVSVPAATIAISRNAIPDVWRDYLYWTDELEA